MHKMKIENKLIESYRIAIIKDSKDSNRFMTLCGSIMGDYAHLDLSCM